MGKETKISWCDSTFNPWIGCSKVSAGCKFCYAETMNNRMGWSQWGPGGTRKRTSASYWKQPYRWQKEAEANNTTPRVFCASLADVFEERADLELYRTQLHRIITETPLLDWLILTKRPKFAVKWFGDEIPVNVWLGTSVENQETADERVPALLESADCVRFLSCEPLLGPVDLRPWLEELNWVIVGGESGPKAREMDPVWARSIRDQCHVSTTPFFMKQMTKRRPIPGDLMIREIPVFKA